MERKKRFAAVFLDRDGTINEEVGYLDRLERLRILPGAAEAVRRINESGLKAVVVTNQSGVARGYFTEAFVRAVHDRIRKTLRREGAEIDRFYYCPHHPSEGIGEYRKNCSCRKPEPGMLKRASEELDIDLNRSYFVGDTLKDVETGRRAGTKTVLVRTGYGDAETIADIRPDCTADNLLDAVRWILKDRA
ncbi:MAG: D-glycero-beta-D-manno-heptose-1,7-bisphosphate 7-phosphatase [Syntrophaceae bacterium PtaU1.Bin231]|nr:MAG: D-glycero-beta-D-manno-heptose-1,7-bisphosphate 7-phosphatase [Syntrophaceae bacterium PtaU1.Bin231]